MAKKLKPYRDASGRFAKRPVKAPAKPVKAPKRKPATKAPAKPAKAPKRKPAVKAPAKPAKAPKRKPAPKAPPKPVKAPKPRKPRKPKAPPVVEPVHVPYRKSKPPQVEPSPGSLVDTWEGKGAIVTISENADESADYEFLYRAETPEAIRETLLDFEIDTEGVTLPPDTSTWFRASLWFENRTMSIERRKTTGSVLYDAKGLWVRWSSPTPWERRGNVLELIRTWAENLDPKTDTCLGWGVGIWHSPFPGDYPTHWKGEE